MILYIDFEHKDLSTKDPELALNAAGRRLRAKYRFEEMAQDTCLIVRYDRFSQSLFTELGPKAIVCSGHNTLHSDYDTDDLVGVEWLLKTLPIPLFTICGSFQSMLQLWGAEIGPLRRKPGAEDVSLMEQYGYEKGYCEVIHSAGPPLLEGIPTEMTMHQNHFWEVKSCPVGFTAIASSELCALQAVVHNDSPVFGCQFHPEEFSEEHDHGRILLQNFFDQWIND